VEEQRHSAQVDAPPPPPVYSVKHGGKNGNTCRRIQNSRNS